MPRNARQPINSRSSRKMIRPSRRPLPTPINPGSALPILIVLLRPVRSSRANYARLLHYDICFFEHSTPFLDVTLDLRTKLGG